MKRQGTEKCVQYTPSFGGREEKRVHVCTCAKGDSSWGEQELSGWRRGWEEDALVCTLFLLSNPMI